MNDAPKIAALDIAELERWLDDPAAPLGDLMAELPFLRTEAEARAYLDDLRVGLDDIKHGRTVPHEQVVRDAAERRNRYRVSAAE